MTFEQFAAIVCDWQSRLTPEQARAGAESLRRQIYIPDLPDAIPLGAVLVAIAKGGPAPVPDPKPKPRISPAPKRRARRASQKAISGTGLGLRGRPSRRAQALVREQLAHGPKRGEEVRAAGEAAEISGRTLIAAADALGVRVRKGQWWLPGGSESPIR